jgi:AraC-like DNA-binding protein
VEAIAVKNIICADNAPNAGITADFADWYALCLTGDTLNIAKVEESGNTAEAAYIYFNLEAAGSFNIPEYNLTDTVKRMGNGGYGVQADDWLLGCFERLRGYAAADSAEKGIMMPILLVQIIVGMDRAHTKGSAAGQSVKGFKDNNKINDIINYITLNITRKITLGELEKEFYINKFYLCHLFKDITGYTVTEYISRKKVALAKELLRENNSPVSVCAQVGYDDYSNFYRVFKKAAGMSPKAYQLMVEAEEG